MEDGDLFNWAQVEDRAIVTENVSDFVSPFTERMDSGLHSAGIVFTDNRRLPSHRSELFISWMIDALEKRLNAGHGMVVSPPQPDR